MPFFIDTNRWTVIVMDSWISTSSWLQHFMCISWKGLMLTAFQMFDTDGDGFITPEELEVVSLCFTFIVYMNSNGDNMGGKILL